MKSCRALTALATFGLAVAFAAPAFAANVPLPADGQWNAFSVAGDLEPSLAWIDDSGSPLGFDFSIGAGLVGTLTIVDAVFGGDTFKVTNFGNLLGSTSGVPLADIGSAVDHGYDFDAALADSSFSSAVFTLGAGSYRIGGFLDQSLLLDGLRLDSTAGALRLSVAPIPEPSTYAILLAGLGVVGLVARRRRS